MSRSDVSSKRSRQSPGPSVRSRKTTTSESSKLLQTTTLQSTSSPTPSHHQLHQNYLHATSHVGTAGATKQRSTSTNKCFSRFSHPWRLTDSLSFPLMCDSQCRSVDAIFLISSFKFICLPTFYVGAQRKESLELISRLVFCFYPGSTLYTSQL